MSFEFETENIKLAALSTSMAGGFVVAGVLAFVGREGVNLVKRVFHPEHITRGRKTEKKASKTS